MSNNKDDSDDDWLPLLSGWEKYIEKGKKLHQCMVETFDDSFDESGKIVEFCIYHVYASTDLEAQQLVEDGFKDEIHKQLLPWLHTERSSGRLFQEKDWKPFRDPYDPLDIFYGYRKLFVFDKYYFQLEVDDWGIRKEDGPIKQTVTFYLRLYGWKEKDTSYVQHYGRVTIDEDTMRMPSYDWYKK